MYTGAACTRLRAHVSRVPAHPLRTCTHGRRPAQRTVTLVFSPKHLFWPESRAQAVCRPLSSPCAPSGWPPPPASRVLESFRTRTSADLASGFLCSGHSESGIPCASCRWGEGSPKDAPHPNLVQTTLFAAPAGRQVLSWDGSRDDGSSKHPPPLGAAWAAPTPAGCRLGRLAGRPRCCDALLTPSYPFGGN